MQLSEKTREDLGTIIPVRVVQWDSADRLNKLKEHEIDKEDGWVDAEVVMHELKIGKKRLQNLIATGKISKDMFTICANGLKKFRIKKILGIE